VRASFLTGPCTDFFLASSVCFGITDAEVGVGLALFWGEAFCPAEFWLKLALLVLDLEQPPSPSERVKTSKAAPNKNAALPLGVTRRVPARSVDIELELPKFFTIHLRCLRRQPEDLQIRGQSSGC
jgi:hypothetical protein